MSIEQGIIAGLWGGCIMALLSEAGFRLGISRSSLMLVDGFFAFRAAGRQPAVRLVYAVGALVHLFTSAIFGLAYTVGCAVAGLSPYSLPVLVLYVFLLWLAMLFIALPISGQGLFGRRMGPYTPVVQLVVHAGFLAGFWQAMG